MQSAFCFITGLEFALSGKRILIDAREFLLGRFTGIARVLEGLIGALSVHPSAKSILLASYDPAWILPPLRSRNEIEMEQLPKSFFRAEKRLSDLTKSTDLFISPYPKLPLFGVHCRAIHFIHDVLDVTHPLYRRRPKLLFDRYRVRKALRRADITWYDSSWSLQETQKHFSLCGRNPVVRHLGIDERFRPQQEKGEESILESYGLREGYILALGNGLPHKNLGVLLQIEQQMTRRIVLVGASDANRQYWTSRHPAGRSVWIRHADERDLPALLRGAFCLVQPSLIEGYGYPPLEAMACGTPAIISSIPVLVETTGGNAMTADANDEKAWMRALKALEDPVTYRGKVQGGLEWVEPLRGPKGWSFHLQDIERLF